MNPPGRGAPDRAGVRDAAAARAPGRFRYWSASVFFRLAVRVYLRLRPEHVDRLPAGPAILCFNHQSWADPFILAAAIPARPDLMFFGPREADLSVGAKNRLIRWTQRSIPFRPDKTGLRDVARRVAAELDRGSRIAIAPEGRIHVGERVVLPLDEGTAFFALRSGVPIIPIAINGTGWLRFGGTVRVRVGEPIATSGQATREAVSELTTATWRALLELVADGRDRPPPGPIGRWLTEAFQEWPGGSRPVLDAASSAADDGRA
jgi:1-acyl-sn-glycerol-3-phosphate acyltransferase